MGWPCTAVLGSLRGGERRGEERKRGEGRGEERKRGEGREEGRGGERRGEERKRGEGRGEGMDIAYCECTNSSTTKAATVLPIPEVVRIVPL